MSNFFDRLRRFKSKSTNNLRVKQTTTPRPSSKPTSILTADGPEDQVIIGVIGWTGTGKSLFISRATGVDVPIGHSLDLCTKHIDIVKVSRPERCNRDIVFLDTPGFDDIKTDMEILEMLLRWLEKRYKRKVTLDGLLYLHRISDNRMMGTPLRNIRRFKELCGDDALRKITLVTTMWSEVDEDTGSQREKELREIYWKTMIDQGSRTARFEGALDSESAWAVLGRFIQPELGAHR